MRVRFMLVTIEEANQFPLRLTRPFVPVSRSLSFVSKSLK